MSLSVQSSDSHVWRELGTIVNRYLRRSNAATMLYWNKGRGDNGGGWETWFGGGGVMLGRMGGGHEYFRGGVNADLSNSAQFGGNLTAFRFRSFRWNKDLDSGQIDLFAEAGEYSYGTNDTRVVAIDETNGAMSSSSANATPAVWEHLHLYDRRLEAFEMGRLAMYPASIKEGLCLYIPMLSITGFAAWTRDRGVLYRDEQFTTTNGSRLFDDRRSMKTGIYMASLDNVDYMLRLSGKRRRFRFSNTISGTSDLQTNVFDSITITESVTCSLSDLQINVNDSISLTESVPSPTIVNDEIYTTVFNSITLAEFLVLSLSDLEINVQDSISTSESVSVNLIFLININDAISLTESISVFTDLNININDLISCEDSILFYDDTVTVSETVDVEIISVGNELEVSVFDTISVTELISIQENDHSIVVNDQISLVESTTLNLIYNINLNDAISLSESISVFSDQNINVLDSISLQENLTVQNTLLEVLVNDSINLVDIVNIAVSDLTISVSDNINVVEQLSLNLVYFINLNESTSLAELVDLLLDINVDKNDAVSISENVSVENLLLKVDLFDSINVEESYTITTEQEGVVNIPVLDSVSVTDNILVLNSDLGNIVVNDTVSLTENVNILNELNINCLDVVSISEQFFVAPELVLNIEDSISIVDFNSVILSLAINKNETISLTEQEDIFTDINTNIFDIVVTDENQIIANTNLGFIDISDSVLVDDIDTVELPGLGRSIYVYDETSISDIVSIDKTILTETIKKMFSSINSSLRISSKINNSINLSSVSRED